MAKAVKSKVSKPVSKDVTKKAVAVLAKAVTPDVKKKVAKASPAKVVTPKVAARAISSELPTIETKKKVSDKLIETIEKRKAQQEAAKQAGRPTPFGGKVPGRRGRRPKNIEYTPENREDDEVAASDNEFERIEYDTGIRVGQRSFEDKGFGFERSEDFDEELNFDW